MLTFYPYLEEPKIDLLDLAAVILRHPLACLNIKQSALEPSIFRKLVACSMAFGYHISDLNGNIGHPDEYQNAAIRQTHVPVLIFARQRAHLERLVLQHQLLQPRGFEHWARYLGMELAYPDCCVDHYVAKVKQPSDRNDFWRDVKSKVITHEEIILGFAPCSFSCEKAQNEIFRRLLVAHKIGVLNVEVVKRWLLKKGKENYWQLIDTSEPIVDLSEKLIGFKIPLDLTNYT